MKKINMLEIRNVAKSKHMLYRILTVEGGVYLPPKKNVAWSSFLKFELKIKGLMIFFYFYNAIYVDPLFKGCLGLKSTTDNKSLSWRYSKLPAWLLWNHNYLVPN